MIMIAYNLCNKIKSVQGILTYNDSVLAPLVLNLLNFSLQFANPMGGYSDEKIKLL